MKILDRNRRASASLSPVLIHFISPSSYLSRKLQELLQREQAHGRLLLPPIAQRHPGPQKPAYGISKEEWPTVVCRIVENQEPLQKVADDYGVSHETIRRIVIAVRKQEESRVKAFSCWLCPRDWRRCSASAGIFVRKSR